VIKIVDSDVVNLVTPPKQKKKKSKPFKSLRKQQIEPDLSVDGDPNNQQLLEDEALARRLQDRFSNPPIQYESVEDIAVDADALLARQFDAMERSRFGSREFVPRPRNHYHRYYEPPSVPLNGFNMPFGGGFGIVSHLFGGPPNISTEARRGLFGQLFSRARNNLLSGTTDRNLLRLSLMNRDFNENDYELLLQLDEGVKTKGASKSSIDSLPIQKIEKFESPTTCCICLTEMEDGCEIKKLPCSHFYHPECIDQWLIVNKTCPVDKKPIDETTL